MKFKNFLKRVLSKIGYVKSLQIQVENFKNNSCFPPGHFYSPIISVVNIKERQKEIWTKAKNDGIAGIELNTKRQIELLNKLSLYYKEIPFSEEKNNNRYFFNNNFYSYTDGIILYSMIRHFSPKKIVEVGSGFSSAVMLDTNQLFFDSRIKLFFIEPYPINLDKILTENDRKTTILMQTDLQIVPLETFRQLEANDILFIDSTHVAKTGSDVNFIFFEILPILKSGVIIHFHDIFYPFEYPQAWVFGGRNWNEDYFLKAFLMYLNSVS